MYFLEHFNEIMKDYEERIGTAVAFYTPEHRRFVDEMNEFQTMIREMKKKEKVSAKDRENIAIHYGIIFNLYSRQLEKGRNAKYSHLNAMRNEKDALLWLDTTSEKTLEQAVTEANAVQAADKQNRENKVDKPSQFYMFDMKDSKSIKIDLDSDNAMITELERSIANSKKHVYGTPSPQYTEMEAAFNAFKQLNLELRNSNVLGDREKEAYRQSLGTLTKAAKAYEDYKLVNGTKQMSDLKSKEVRRVETSRLLQAFAGKRVERINRSLERDQFRENVELKIQAYDEKYKMSMNKIEKNSEGYYLLEKLNLEDKAARFPSSADSIQDFASNVFKNLHINIKPKSGNEEIDRVSRLKVIIKAAFGDISGDLVFKDMGEKLLENGVLPKKDYMGQSYTSSDFANSAKSAVDNAKKNNPEKYNHAALEALRLFAKKISSMDSIQPNFVFLTDLAKFTYEAEAPENRKKFTKTVVNTVKGMEEAGKIVRDGMKSWKNMLKVEPGERAKYDQNDMLNYYTMRVFEAGMWQFAKLDSHNKINPMFYYLGSTENGAEKLKETILRSNGMKLFITADWETKAGMLSTTNVLFESYFSRSMQKSFKTTFDITAEDQAKYEAEFKGTDSEQSKKEENVANILF